MMIGSVVCMLLPSRLTNCVDHLFSAMVSPLSGDTRNLALSVTDKSNNFGTVEIPVEQYQKLQQENRRNRNRFISLWQELCYQRELTERLTGLRQRFGMSRVDFIAAFVTGSDSSNNRQIMILDQSRHVKPGQIVLSSTGLRSRPGDDPGDPVNDVYQNAVVGQISQIGLSTSSVQLITDPQSKLKVVIVPVDRPGGKRASGILNGLGMGRLSVSMVPITYPVKAGDAVLLCAGRETLPVEMLVGFVKSRKHGDPPVIWEIQVTPAVNLNELREVVVVISR